MGWRHPSLCALYSTFIYAFICTVLLLVYIHFSTLPGRYSKSDTLNHTLERNIEPAIGVRFAVEQSDDTENLASLGGTDSVEYTNVIPVIDFKDLGHKKRKLLLLIIVSTAPGRFKRRQGIRETWWKNCHDNREVRGNKKRCNRPTLKGVDLFCNGNQIKYSFVLMLISLSNPLYHSKNSKEYLN